MTVMQCTCFFKFLTQCRQSELSKLQIYARLLGNDPEIVPNRATAKIIKFASDLIPLLPLSPRTSPEFPPIEHATLTGLVTTSNRDGPFVIPVHVLDISVPLQRKIRSQPPQAPVPTDSPKYMSKYTPSHNRHLRDLANNGTALVFNCMTKSTQVGHEGGPHVVHHSDALPPTRDLHDLLERLEVIENDRSAILSFTEHSKVYDHQIDRAGFVVYGEGAWGTIQKCLVDDDARAMVIARCRASLVKVEKEHYDGVQYVMQSLETQTTNAFLQSLTLPPIEGEFTFGFPMSDTVESEYLNDLVLENSTATHRNPNVIWFISEALPELKRKLEKAMIFSKSLICSLYYYAKLCELISMMFSRDPLTSDSWDAVLDSAYDRAREKFLIDDSKLPRKVISKILKSILTARTIVDENADEIAKHMGQWSKYVAHFFPMYCELNRACTALHSDPHFQLLMKYANAFGGQPRYRKLYAALAQFPSDPELYELHMSQESGMVTVQPFSPS
jgi:hypothetical protein